jgi:hypothetical protein
MELEELLERTKILKQTCEIRLNAGSDSISITGKHGLTQYLDSMEVLLQALMELGHTELAPAEEEPEPLVGPEDLTQGFWGAMPDPAEVGTSMPVFEGGSVTVCATGSLPIMSYEEAMSSGVPVGEEGAVVVLPPGQELPMNLLRHVRSVRVIEW